MGKVAVVGGGIAGLQVSLDLARLGHEVTILEKNDRLGGRLARLHCIYPTMLSSQDLLSSRLNDILSNAAIEVRTKTEVTTITGCPQDFELNASSEGGEIKFKSDAIVLATGLETIDPKIIPEFGHDRYQDVLTSLELEEMLRSDSPTHGELKRPSDGEVPRIIVFVQCVGSRAEKRGVPYCSVTCCAGSIKNAIRIKERLSEAEVFILYIDIRTAGKGLEDLYKQARRKGIRFIRGQPSMVLEKNGKLMVMGENTLIRELYEIPADLVVLAVGVKPLASTMKLMRQTGIEMTSEDLPREGPLSSVLSSQEGIFLAGTVESPKDVRETIMHADACAQKVDEYLRNACCPPS